MIFEAVAGALWPARDTCPGRHRDRSSQSVLDCCCGRSPSAAPTATRLSTAVIDEAAAALRALTEHRDDLVRTRTQTINRLHALPAQLFLLGCPAG